MQKVLVKKRDPVSHVCFMEELAKVSFLLYLDYVQNLSFLAFIYTFDHPSFVLYIHCKELCDVWWLWLSKCIHSFIHWQHWQWIYVKNENHCFCHKSIKSISCLHFNTWCDKSTIMIIVSNTHDCFSSSITKEMLTLCITFGMMWQKF